MKAACAIFAHRQRRTRLIVDSSFAFAAHQTIHARAKKSLQVVNRISSREGAIRNRGTKVEQRPTTLQLQLEVPERGLLYSCDCLSIPVEI